MAVIISALLSQEEEGKLVELLKEYREAISWTMSDIKGINPTIYMHKILMEEGGKPVGKSKGGSTT